MQKIHTTDDEVQAMQNYLDNLLDEKRSIKLVTKGRLRTLAFGLVLLLLANVLFSVIFARSRGLTPDIFGLQFYQIESGSMEPSYHIGDIIISRKYDGERELEVGDVITFRTKKNMIVTHRIVELSSDESGRALYQTKGDNPDNSIDIDMVSGDQILAVAIKKLSLK